MTPTLESKLRAKVCEGVKLWKLDRNITRLSPCVAEMGSVREEYKLPWDQHVNKLPVGKNKKLFFYVLAVWQKTDKPNSEARWTFQQVFDFSMLFRDVYKSGTYRVTSCAAPRFSQRHRRFSLFVFQECRNHRWWWISLWCRDVVPRYLHVCQLPSNVMCCSLFVKNTLPISAACYSVMSKVQMMIYKSLMPGWRFRNDAEAQRNEPSWMSRNLPRRILAAPIPHWYTGWLLSLCSTLMPPCLLLFVL